MRSAGSLAPARGCRRCALIIFSHGAYSNYHDYDALLEDWAAHGMVVAAPLHVDSSEYPERGRYSMLESRALRLADYAAVDLALRPGAPALLNGISFSGKVFAAGHSYGGLIVEVVGGARLDADAEVQLARSWRMPLAVVALSPPGEVPGFVTTPGFAAMERPTLVVSGTADMLKGYFDSYQVHLTSYRAGPAGRTYSLVFDGMDHAFNGAYWKVTPDGGASAWAITALNADILRFLDDAARGKPPTRAEWRAFGVKGVTAEAK